MSTRVPNLPPRKTGLTEKKRMSREEALKVASEHGLEWEVSQSMDAGMTPEEALEDWDIFPGA